MPDPLRSRGPAADLAYQKYILEHVSRTFALTIPQLPSALSDAVGNAYLLCRIADTIEDDTGLDADLKRQFAEQFIAVLEGEAASVRFANELSSRLAPMTPESERDLIRNTPRVVAVTQSFSSSQQTAMRRCVRIMSRGMARFQQQASLSGLEDVSALDRYCYHVAGVVGEMLTELFCDYSREINQHRDELMGLAVSFGQGLQMTNILKDIWEDYERGACWLPRDVFDAAGFDLRNLSPGQQDARFRQGLFELIAIARLHLRNALKYTLFLPKQESGIRRFCLWALGMAVLTLRKVHSHPDFSDGAQVKITRGSVKATVALTSALVGQDEALRLLFSWLTRGLPQSHRPASALSA